MNTTPNGNTNNQEIDLAFLYTSLKNFIDNIGFLIFRIFNFFIRNFVITLVLILLGVGLAYFQYLNNSKAYKHELIVVPNFNSTGYLYNKVENFSKNSELKNTTLKHISNLKVEPIIDVFQFVSDNKQNLEIAKYMSENTIEVNKFKKDSDVEKLYKYHKLSYYTDVEDLDLSIYNTLIQELNKDVYLNERKSIEILETKNKLKEYEYSIENINNIFKKLGNVGEQSKDLNVEMYSQINDLLLSKKDFLNEIKKAKVELVEQSKIVYDASRSLNMKNSNILYFIFFPMLFNFLFLISVFIMKQYKRYKAKYSHS